jgi:hypothetical protein
VLAEHRQADVELETLQISTVLLQYLILGDTSGSSSLAASLAMVAKEVDKWVNVMAANGVWWGTQSALLTALSHFPDLEPMELLGSVRDADLSDGQEDALWPLVRVASDSLVSLNPSSLARDPSYVME